jgi:hypothetical protein
MGPPAAAMLPTRILHAAWWSILIGIGIELALIAAAAVFGKAQDLRPFIADLAGKLSWSVFVCVGISIGTAAAKARGPAMGVLGLLSAPAAFAIAKAAHKSAAQALDVAVSAGAGPTSGQMIAIRACEYALLGLAAGELSRRPWGRLPAFAGLGLLVGFAAAALVLWITLRATPATPPTLALVSKGINEVLFPLGCSIVLYAVNTLGDRSRLTVAV